MRCVITGGTQEGNVMKLFLRYRLHLGLIGAFLLGFAVAGMLRPAPAVAGLDLGDLVGKGIKVAGVKVAVDQFGGKLNSFINKVMDNNDVSTNSASKVVTIVTPVGNQHVGAAQVVGSKEAVEKVGAVALIETSFMDKLFRIKVLIPIEGADASKLKRVPGVGVSAVIDVKI
jgi:hypothetical protein